MKKLLLLLIILLALAGCASLSAKPNVVKVDNCSDDEGYAWSNYTEITNNEGFSSAYTCKFPVGTTCEQAKSAKRIEVVGQGFMYKECKIVK